MIALILTLVIYALIFYVLFWGLGYIGIPEPFNKVIKVLIVICIVIVIIGLLTSKIAPFSVLSNLSL